MILKLFSALCAALVYFGFASMLGAMLHQVRRSRGSDIIMGITAFSVLVFIPFSLALPMPAAARWICWISALLLMWLYVLRPVSLPDWLWRPRTALLYAASVMALVMLWSLAASPTVLAPVMDVLAASTALLAWRRSRLFPA